MGLARALVQVILEPNDQKITSLYNPDKLRNALQEAFDALYAQDGNLKRHRVLSIDSCKALLTIREMVKWEIVEEGFRPSAHGGKHAIVRPDKVLDRDDFFWSWCLGNHVIAPGEDHNKQRYWVLRWAVDAEHERQKLLLFGTRDEWEAFRSERWNAEAVRRWNQTKRKT